MRSAIVLVSLVAMTGAARADGITWDAPEGCPTADAVVAGVVANLGRPLADGDVDAQLAVTRRGHRWHVTITMHDGTRELEAATCRDLADSAALILALAIDPDAGSPPEVVITEPAKPDPPRPPPEPVADLHRIHIDTSEDEPTPLPLAVRVRALVGGDLGSLPGAASGWGAGAVVAFGPWAIDASIAQFAEQQTKMLGSEFAFVGLMSLDARGCYTGGSWYRAGGCVGADLALTHSQGKGFGTNLDQKSTGGGLQFGATWAVKLLGPFAARVDVAATWQLVRTVLTDGSGNILHDPDIVVWRGFAGLEASWR